MNMQMMGAYSGIDMSVVDQLIEAEAAKGQRYTRQKEEYQESQSAWRDLNTQLDSFYNQLENFQDITTFESKTISNTGEEHLSVSADADAATGQYRVQVQNLATQTRLTGNRIDVDSIYDPLEIEGSFRVEIEEGSDPVSITVQPGDSLRDVTDHINEKAGESNVTANIIDNRIVLSHVENGERALSVSGDLTESLGLMNIEAVEGENALFTVDGLQIERSSNSIDDVIEGLTFELTNTHEGENSDIITVDQDTEKATEAVESLVEEYNSIMNYLDQQLDVGDPTAENNSTGALSGDSTITRLQSSFRSLMTQQLDTSSDSIHSLADLGVEIDRYGTASFNQDQFLVAVEEDPENVTLFFYDEDRTGLNANGFSSEMQSLVDEYISDSSGIIKTRTDRYDQMISDVNQRIERFEDRLEMRRDRYIRQFTALDTAMMQAESQLDFMYGQLGVE